MTTGANGHSLSHSLSLSLVIRSSDLSQLAAAITQCTRTHECHFIHFSYPHIWTVHYLVHTSQLATASLCNIFFLLPSSLSLSLSLSHLFLPEHTITLDASLSTVSSTTFNLTCSLLSTLHHELCENYSPCTFSAHLALPCAFSPSFHLSASFHSSSLTQCHLSMLLALTILYLLWTLESPGDFICSSLLGQEVTCNETLDD